MHDLISAIGLLRAPILASLLAVAVLALPSQSREIFREMAQQAGPALAASLARAAAGLVLLAFATLACCLLLIAASPPVRRPALDRFRHLLQAVALALPVLPLAVVALVWVYEALRPPPTPGAEDVSSTVLAAAGIVLTALLLVAMLRLSEARERIASRVLAALAPLRVVPAWAGLVVPIGAVAGISWVAVDHPTVIADIVGPLLLMVLFFAFLCVGASLLTFVFDRYHVPLLSILVAGAFLWSHLGWNNNHQLRLMTATAPTAVDAQDAFRAWLEARGDLADFAGRPYPVYIVTAEGGGIYAAAHTAMTLAALQDGCPRFASHVFAISGVSGGSLGAALFSGLVGVLGPPPGKALPIACAAPPDLKGPYQSAVARYLDEDLLTPLLAATLFPDAVQRFLPVAFGRLDRARALEASFEEAWRRTMRSIGRTGHDDDFARPLKAAWSATGNAPALLLNATVIQRGDRVVVAPFTLEYATGFKDAHLDVLNHETVVSISTAITASARFPLVTPPGLHIYGDEHAPKRIQLVDGGYYDNSGVRTAVELIDKLRQPQAGQSVSPDARGGATDGCATNNAVSITTSEGTPVRVCFKIIVVRSVDIPLTPPLYGELLSPMIALYEARIGMGHSNLRAAQRHHCGGEDCGLGHLARDPHIYFKHVTARDLPLGWYLSATSLDRIARPPTVPVDCDAVVKAGQGLQSPSLSTPLDPRMLPVEENVCLVARLAADLQGR